MWRAHTHSGQTFCLRDASHALVTHTTTINVAALVTPLVEQRRHSFKYAKKAQHDEMRQPFYIHEKRHGIFSNEHNIGKARRGLPYITPLYTKHMNLWETDTDASNNRFFRNYVFGQRELHQLLGRPHAFEADGVAGRQGDTAYELSTDVRYKGVPRPAITNLHYEPELNHPLYRHDAHGNQLTNPRSPLTEEVLGPELLHIRDIKSFEHCKAWFDRLHYLIQLHYDAVGDVGDFKSRHTQHVHEFFVCFHDALSSFDLRDTHLLEQLHKARPAALEDLFAIFLEMENNYVHMDYCPRCSLPTATTRYCGEGDEHTPFRKHRGRWAPHQGWGKEWFNVVVRRAEALWYRSTEDPYFGTPQHTQRQATALLHVYAKTQSRAKAVDFLHSLRGSLEYLTGKIKITEDMQRAVDHLLDTTPHPHLLTNSFKLESQAAIYTGAVGKVPHSPLQTRIDLELDKYRRQQREEGAVRVPPALWRLDTSAIVPYKLNDKHQITNWREVKQGIEESFLATGLPREAYSSGEQREMAYLTHVMPLRAARQAELETQLQSEKRQRQHGGSTTSASSFIVFPDEEWYRVFDTSAAALKAFGVGASGTTFVATTKVYPDPTRVPLASSAAEKPIVLDTTDEGCRVFGGHRSGDVLRVSRGGDDAEEVVVVGVNVAGAEEDWCLVAEYTDLSRHPAHELLELGRDVLDIRSRFAQVERTGRQVQPVPALAEHRTATEEVTGQVVGVRQNILFVQWRLLRGGDSVMDRSVAMPLGPASAVRAAYHITPGEVQPLLEPPSWRTPFRNSFLDERLQELQRAPFEREQWSSLIQGKYTPKVKRFGYTQHQTQDDFATKEYADRLLSRQYFHNPRAFEVLPERRAPSVRFRGKWEYQRTCGLPTVDRGELENGWSASPAVSDDEINVLEQALRDISGRRPGNFVKSPSETQHLRIQEPWWTPLHYGWEQHNREERAFKDSSEQHIIESTRLPFHGHIPPFGTSYGIGERIRAIAEDYSRGFGLGPNGHAPGHHDAAFNTLGSETARVRTVGLGNALVRLFEEKLDDTDIHAWALEQCGDKKANARQLLLSVHEWRQKGRPPSLLLAEVLRRYLKAEIDTFNAGLPVGVPRLAVPTDGATLRSSGGAPDGGSPWWEVDPAQYRLEYADTHPQGDSDVPYIVGLVQRASLGVPGSITDEYYADYLKQSVLRSFQLAVAEAAGRNLPPAFVSQKTAHIHRGSVRASGNVITFIRSAELAKVLEHMRVSSEGIATVLRGLANCPEHEPLGDDFAVPTSLIFSWRGPGSGAGSSAAAARGGNRNARAGPGGTSVLSQALSSQRSDIHGGGHEGKMVVQILEAMSLVHDGLVMDIRYAVRENKRNPVLRREFFTAFLPVFKGDHKKVSRLYDDYCDGKYVPNVTVAIEAFVHFLAGYSQHPARYTDAAAVEYFDTDASGRHPGQVTQLKLLPPALGVFQFESTLAESIETVRLFDQYGILAGPTRVPATGFIAANCKSLNYLSHRPEEVVHVTLDNDQGLRRALRQSAHYATIAANPSLHTLLNSASGSGVVATFNRFLYRVAPLLHFYENIVRQYESMAPALQMEASNANRGLARVLESEQSPSIEQEFRRNAERYWRGVLEGRSVEESIMLAPPSSAAGGGGARSPDTTGSRGAPRRTTASGVQDAPGTPSGRTAAGKRADSWRSTTTTSGGSGSGDGGGTAQRRGPNVSRQSAAGGSGSRSMQDLLSKISRSPKGGKRGGNNRNTTKRT